MMGSSGPRASSLLLSLLASLAWVGHHGAGGCQDVEFVPNVVRIIATECSYWYIAGRVEGTDGESLLTFSRDCRSQAPAMVSFSGEGGQFMSVDEKPLYPPEPEAISLLGSQTAIKLSGCSEEADASAVESVTRTRLGTSTLDYKISQSRGQWNMSVNAFPTTSVVYDFIQTTPGTGFGDRVARATSHPANVTGGTYSGLFCSQGDESKWVIELLTSDPVYRRAVVAMVVMKAMRDDRREVRSGETASSVCYDTYMALVLGLPILGLLICFVAALIVLISRAKRARRSEKVTSSPETKMSKRGGKGSIEEVDAVEEDEEAPADGRKFRARHKGDVMVPPLIDGPITPAAVAKANQENYHRAQIAKRKDKERSGRPAREKKLDPFASTTTARPGTQNSSTSNAPGQGGAPRPPIVPRLGGTGPAPRGQSRDPSTAGTSRVGTPQQHHKRQVRGGAELRPHPPSHDYDLAAVEPKPADVGW